MKLADIKRAGKRLAKRTGYYTETYGDMTVAELLLVLEDENWHTAETLVEALARLDYYSVIELCKIILEHHEKEDLSQELLEKRQAIDNKIRSEK